MVFQEILDRQSWHRQFIKEKHFYIVNVYSSVSKLQTLSTKDIAIKDEWMVRERGYGQYSF